MQASEAVITAVANYVRQNQGTKRSIRAIRADLAELLGPADDQSADSRTGEGRPELRNFIVARCYVQSNRERARGFGTALPGYLSGKCKPKHINNWDTDWGGIKKKGSELDPAITAAREAYNRGEVEICTARDGQWMILYAIPKSRRRVPDVALAIPYAAVVSR